jgi:hypothetical protein
MTMKDDVSDVSAAWLITAKGPMYDVTRLTGVAAGDLAEEADTLGAARVGDPSWRIDSGYLYGSLPTYPADAEGCPGHSFYGLVEDLVDVPRSVYVAVYGEPKPVKRVRGPYRKTVRDIPMVVPIDLTDVAA